MAISIASGEAAVGAVWLDFRRLKNVECRASLKGLGDGYDWLACDHLLDIYGGAYCWHVRYPKLMTGLIHNRRALAQSFESF